MFGTNDISALLALYLVFGALLAVTMFVLLPQIERGRLDWIYPTSLRQQARRNASSILDVLHLDIPGSRLGVVVRMSVCWPYVLFGRRR